MKEKKQTHSVSISRREFLKSGFAISAAATMSLSYPAFLFSSPQNGFKPIFSIDGFIDPYGIAVGSDGLIYVTDAGGYCVKVFDENGNLVRTIGSAGSDGARFNYPQGIDVDEDGNIYVVDSNNGRVAIFSPDGNLKESFGSIGGYPGAFYTPKGIFVNDKIYTCNTRNHRLSVFDKTTHELIGSFGDFGDDPQNLQQGSLGMGYHFRLPTDVAVSENGEIYVVDSKHGEVKILNQSGEFIKKFGENGSGDGQLNLPEGIALDKEGNVYVCDAMNGRIQKFDPEGNFLAILDAELKRPTSIFIDSSNKFYVIDAELKQVIKFE
jgi:DNA-binding beta-propeller fold protein YncE